MTQQEYNDYIAHGGKWGYTNGVPNGKKKAAKKYMNSVGKYVNRIGDKVKGKINGVDTEVFIYNISDHKEAYNEVGSQGISYTAGVPPVAAAMLVATGEWDAGKMVNVEELDAKPFINLLNKIGLPTRIKDGEGDRALEFDI